MLHKLLFLVLNDRLISKGYHKRGSIFGEAVSYLYMGRCTDFKQRFSRWMIWEKEYLKRGFRSLPIDEFVNASYGLDISNKMMVSRKEGEGCVFHAKIYEERYLGKVERVIDLEKTMQGEVQTGYWRCPSTADAVVHT